MPTPNRSKSYILVPVEIEVLADLDDPTQLNVGTIRMPSEKDIRRSIEAHGTGKVATWFSAIEDAWRELFYNTPGL